MISRGTSKLLLTAGSIMLFFGLVLVASITFELGNNLAQCQSGNSPQPFPNESECIQYVPTYMLFGGPAGPYTGQGYRALEAGTILLFFGFLVLMTREYLLGDKIVPEENPENKIRDG